jgi:hypothetical protein
MLILNGKTPRLYDVKHEMPIFIVKNKIHWKSGIICGDSLY